MRAEQYVRARTSLAAKTIAILSRLFTNLGSYRDADADRFRRDAVPILQGAQRTLGQLVSVRIASAAEQAGRSRTAPPSVPDDGLVDLRGGVNGYDEYLRPFETLWYALSQGDTISQAVERGHGRLIQLADVDLQMTEASAARTAMQKVGATWWKRVPQGEKTCLLCIVAATRAYRVDSLKPIHPGCVPAGQRVRAKDVLSMTRRWYTGELAVITASNGDEVTVTPNHPVLTKRGWVPAAFVRPGDHVVRGSGLDWKVRGRPDEGHGPSLVEDVWASLSMSFGFVKVPLASEDFHGDGTNGEVDVIRTDGDFTSVGDFLAADVLGESPFMGGHLRRGEVSRLGASALLVPGGVPSSGRLVGGSGLGSLLLDVELGRPHHSSLRRSSSVNVGISEPSFDYGSGDAVLVGDDVLGNSVVDVVGAEFFERVSDVGGISFSGHVYNFQTRSGWYESNSLIVHNCDCDIEPQFSERPAEGVTDADVLRKAYAAVKDATGKVSTSGVVLRDLLVDFSEDRGEVGPWLAYPRGGQAALTSSTTRNGS